MADVELDPEEARGLLAIYRAAIPSWLKPILAVLGDATWGLFRHDGVMVASAISYSLIFALFPFAIFVVAAGAAFGGSDLAGYLSREALTVLPAHVIETIQPELNRIFAAADLTRPL